MSDVSDAMIVFLLSKPRPKLHATCSNERPVEHMRGHTAHDASAIGAGHCMRPVWGDGRVDGEFYGLCSQCWHEYNAFHGHYVTMQANPASHALGKRGIERLTFADQPPLPALGASVDDCFPAEWT